MKRSLALSAIAVVVVALASACGSNVSGADEGGGAGKTGAGGYTVDPDCYDACIAKGAAKDECEAYCSTGGKGGKGTTSSSGTASSSGSGGAASSSSSGKGGDSIGELEKACIQCWDDHADGVCSAQYEDCEKSLACIQLRNCPFWCGNTPDCIAECNDIIPTGVAPYTAVVQCMACSGGPCEQECEDTAMLAYCN